jgi:hypothetical protein
VGLKVLTFPAINRDHFHERALSDCPSIPVTHVYHATQGAGDCQQQPRFCYRHFKSLQPDLDEIPHPLNPRKAESGREGARTR